jgi:hypothetical protein
MEENEMKVIFGGLIAMALLGLYVYSVLVAIMLAQSSGGGALNSGIILCLTTIGGLVSALVIAELAITQPGAAPNVSNFGPARESSGRAATIIGWVSAAYVGVWILLGLAAFVVGVMIHPAKVQSLTDLGQSWLGLAVAAAYAYFGLNRT